MSETELMNSDTIVRFVEPLDTILRVDDPRYVFDKDNPQYPLTIEGLTLEDEMRYWCQVFFIVSGRVRHDSQKLRIRGTYIFMFCSHNNNNITFIRRTVSGNVPFKGAGC